MVLLGLLGLFVRLLPESLLVHLSRGMAGLSLGLARLHADDGVRLPSLSGVFHLLLGVLPSRGVILDLVP